MKKVIKYKRKRRVKRDSIQTLELHNQGISLRDISKIQGVSKDTARRDILKLSEIIPDNATIERLDKQRIQLLKGTMYRTLEGLNDPDKIEKASLNNAAYAFTQVHGALRLEEGKSTSNISYADALRELKSAKKELNEINAKETSSGSADTGPIPIIREMQ